MVDRGECLRRDRHVRAIRVSKRCQHAPGDALTRIVLPDRTPVTQLSLRPQLNVEVPSRMPMNSTKRSFSVRPTVRVDVDAPSIAPKCGHVVVRVGDIVAGAAIPDFEI